MVVLFRGFNDAVNCFSEDGWALMNPDASDDVIMSIRRTKSFGVSSNLDSVICVKSSLLLQVSCLTSTFRYLFVNTTKTHSTHLDYDLTISYLHYYLKGLVLNFVVLI